MRTRLSICCVYRVRATAGVRRISRISGKLGKIHSEMLAMLAKSNTGGGSLSWRFALSLPLRNISSAAVSWAWGSCLMRLNCGDL
jgi:hypothetical protein